MGSKRKLSCDNEMVDFQPSENAQIKKNKTMKSGQCRPLNSPRLGEMNSVAPRCVKKVKFSETEIWGLKDPTTLTPLLIPLCVGEMGECRGLSQDVNEKALRRSSFVPGLSSLLHRTDPPSFSWRVPLAHSFNGLHPRNCMEDLVPLFLSDNDISIQRKLCENLGMYYVSKEHITVATHHINTCLSEAKLFLDFQWSFSKIESNLPEQLRCLMDNKSKTMFEELFSRLPVEYPGQLNPGSNPPISLREDFFKYYILIPCTIMSYRKIEENDEGYISYCSYVFKKYLENHEDEEKFNMVFRQTNFQTEDIGSYLNDLV